MVEKGSVPLVTPSNLKQVETPVVVTYWGFAMPEILPFASSIYHVGNAISRQAG